MPDPTKVIETARRAAETLRATPGRVGSLVKIDADDVMVVGDLHGNLPALRQLLPIADLARHPGRYLVLQELIHGKWEYPEEGGDRSHQLLDVVAALIVQQAGRVQLILGNHELSELTGRPILKDNLPLNRPFRQGIETAYGARSAEVYAAYLDLFAALPLAIRTTNCVFVCHTLPDAADLETFDPSIYEAPSWTPAQMARRGPVYALTWGRDTSPETADRFATLVDADLFVCGHQPCLDGFRQANPRVLIVDGTNPNPSYCHFPGRGLITIETLVAGAHWITEDGIVGD